MIDLISRFDLEGLITTVAEGANVIALTVVAGWFAWTYIPGTHSWGERLFAFLERIACV
jgi:hypothetical protein